MPSEKPVETQINVKIHFTGLTVFNFVAAASVEDALLVDRIHHELAFKIGLPLHLLRDARCLLKAADIIEAKMGTLLLRVKAESRLQVIMGRL